MRLGLRLWTLLLLMGAGCEPPASSSDTADGTSSSMAGATESVLDDGEEDGSMAGDVPDESMVVPSPWAEPFASEVISFTPGEGAGFGEDDFPDIVLGAPGPGAEQQPSLDVLTLGTGGEIILGFGDRVIVDGPGPDFSVHENPFWPGGSQENVFAEFGEVSVSEDGQEWWTYPCSPVLGQLDTYEGCAGWNPTLPFSVESEVFLDPEKTGGDLFDLANSGLSFIRFVRIRDLSEGGPPPTAGFDLDGVSMIYWDYADSVMEME